MKKVSILLALCIVATFVLSGCNNSLKAKYDCEKYEDFKSAYKNIDREKIKHLIDNETPYEELITKEIDIHYMAEKYFSKGILFYGMLDDLMKDIGVECLRENTGGTLYSVHKVKQGGLLYIFYSNNTRMLRWFYVRNDLSYADVSDALKANSTLEDLKRIDDTMQIFENLYNSDSHEWEYWNYYLAFLYLKDGILELGYQKENNEFVLHPNAPVFIDDFVTEDYEAARHEPYDARIYDMDWVK